MQKEQDKRLTLIAVIVFCSTILLSLIYGGLWEWRGWVSLFILLLATAALTVWMVRYVVETRLRLARYHHKKEIPLDARGEPMYLPGDAQENPNHVTGTEPRQQQAYYR